MHAHAARHRSTIVRPNLVDMPMHAAVGANKPQNAVNEGPVYLVVSPRLRNRFGERVLVVS
jgi:hypothetical protein